MRSLLQLSCFPGTGPFRSAKLSLFAAVALAAGGCATAPVYDLQIKSSAAQEAKPIASYSVEPAKGALDENSLLYREGERLTKRALSGKGYYEAPNAASADVIVELDFNRGPGIISRVMVPVTSLDGQGNLIERMELQYQTTYLKRLNITARNSSGKTVWGVDVTNEDTSKDLRGYLPVMIAASIDYIGRNLPDPENLKISGADPDVQFVKKDL